MIKKKIKILKKLKKYMIASFLLEKRCFLKENNYKMTIHKIHNELYYFNLDFTNMQNISFIFYNLFKK